VIAQQREGRRGERDGAVVLPLPGDMDQAARPIDLGHLAAGPFQETQATGREGDEPHPVDRQAHEREHATDLVATEHDGPSMGLRGAHQRQGGDGLAARALEEALDAAEGDRDGGPGVVPVRREMEDVLAERRVGDQVRRFVDMLREPVDGGEVRLRGPG